MFNRVEDFGSLLSFLQIAPFHDPSFFNARISNSLKKEPEKALETLRKLVQATSLRRTKDSVFGQLHLPKRHNRTNDIMLDGEERRLYEILKNSYKMILEASTISEVQSTPCMFQTILRLRQFCDHGMDLLPRSALAVFEDSMDSKLLTEELLKASQTCALCKKTMKDKDSSIDKSEHFLDCGHQLCSRCEKKQQDDTNAVDIACKVCSDIRTPGNLSPFPYSSGAMDVDIPCRPSSKVKALIQNLEAERNIGASPPIKRYPFHTCTFDTFSPSILPSSYLSRNRSRIQH